MTPRLESVTKQGCLLAAGVAITALIACAGAVAGPERHPTCLPPHSHTIAKDRDVRIYSLAGKAPGQGGPYACLLRRGTTVALATPSRYFSHVIGQVTLAGAIVAYTDSQHSVDSGCTGIVVVDVANGHTLIDVPQVACSVDAGIISFSDITDLVVSYRGSVAWIVHGGGVRQAATFKVHSAQTSGAPALLDEGPAIAPGSLHLSHQTVSWENAGQRRSAHLP